MLAVTPLCPPLNLAGALLGLVAARRIRAAPHALGGARIARAAIITGWVASILWSGGWLWAMSMVQDQLRDSMVETARATIADGVARPRMVRTTHWADAAGAPDAAELQAFATQVSQRYGGLDRVSVTTFASDGGVPRPVYTAALVLHFSGREQRIASAEYVVAPREVRVLLRRLSIADPDLGPLTVGDRRDADPATTGGSETDGT